jgi:hypothetical protein
MALTSSLQSPLATQSPLLPSCMHHIYPSPCLRFFFFFFFRLSLIFQSFSLFDLWIGIGIRVLVSGEHHVNDEVRGRCRSLLLSCQPLLAPRSVPLLASAVTSSASTPSISLLSLIAHNNKDTVIPTTLSSKSLSSQQLPSSSNIVDVSAASSNSNTWLPHPVGTLTNNIMPTQTPTPTPSRKRTRSNSPSPTTSFQSSLVIPSTTTTVSATEGGGSSWNDNNNNINNNKVARGVTSISVSSMKHHLDHDDISVPNNGSHVNIASTAAIVPLTAPINAHSNNTKAITVITAANNISQILTTQNIPAPTTDNVDDVAAVDVTNDNDENDNDNDIEIAAIVDEPPGDDELDNLATI